MKTRILFITPAGERGGAEVILLTILEYLNRDLFEPFVIGLHDGPFIQELRIEGFVEPVVFNTNRFRNVKSFFRTTRRIRDLIKSQQIDIVHCNGTGAQVYGGFAAGLEGVPCIYHLHDTVEWSWNGQSLVHLLAKISSLTSNFFSRKHPNVKVVAISKHVAERWGSGNNVQIIHNAIRDTNTTGTDLKLEHPLVVWVGRLQRWKGAHIFLKAAGIVNQQFPEARFYVVGGTLFDLESEYQNELEDLAKSLNLGSSLQFAGHQSSIQPFLQSADVIVHSSIRPEPFGLVLLEAMNAGKPVIASNEGGPVEIVEDGVTGLLVPPNDPEILANTIVTLLQDQSLREKMGRAAQERVRKHFSPSKMIHAFESLYAELAQ